MIPMVSFIAVVLRLMSLFMLLAIIIPAQKRDFDIETNGLKTLKLYLLGLGFVFLLLNIFPLIQHLCSLTLVCDSPTGFMEVTAIANAMNTLVGTFMLYLIYTKKY